MWSFFRRLFKVAESEAHSAIDKFEDPIKMTEQGIRDLKVDLQGTLKNLAEVKALQIRMRQEADQRKAAATDYEKKAMLLLQRGESGELPKGDADRLASEALSKKEQATTAAVKASKDLQAQDNMISQMESNVKRLSSQISSWEGELATLRARAKVAGATKKINQQLAQVDPTGTIAMLEKMRDKVAQDEALAESYGQIAMLDTNVDAEIDRALAGERVNELKGADSLAALKAKMGIQK